MPKIRCRNKSTSACSTFAGCRLSLMHDAMTAVSPIASSTAFSKIMPPSDVVDGSSYATWSGFSRRPGKRTECSVFSDTRKPSEMHGIVLGKRILAVPGASRVSTHALSGLVIFRDSNGFGWELKADSFDGTSWVNDWVEQTHDVEVPIGEWFQLKVAWVRGNATHGVPPGRSVVALANEAAPQTSLVVFDRIGPNMKDSRLAAWHLFKCYVKPDTLVPGITAHQLIDDLEIWEMFVPPN